MTCDTAKLVLGLLLAFDVCSYHTCSRPASAPLIQGVCDKIAALRAKIIAKKLEMSDPWNPCASKRAHFTDVLVVISSLCLTLHSTACGDLLVHAGAFVSVVVLLQKKRHAESSARVLHVDVYIYIYIDSLFQTTQARTYFFYLLMRLSRETCILCWWNHVLFRSQGAAGTDKGIVELPGAKPETSRKLPSGFHFHMLIAV